MQIITLVQGITNLVEQFIRIILKILASIYKIELNFFFENMRIKRPKTTFNNKKLALEI